MMRARNLIVWLLALLLPAVSCRKEIEPGDLASGCPGSIVLRLDSSTAIRMETKTPTDLQEGLAFQNVLVILTDNTGKVVGRAAKTYTAPYPEDDLIEFDSLLPGNYTAYAYANYDAEDWQDATVTDEEYTVGVGDEDYEDDYLDRELQALTGTDVPKEPVASPASSSMLLTGKLDIALGLTTAEETLYLTRPVVRFKVTVRNNTPFAVTMDDLSFSHFNADKTYLLDHGSDGVPGIPAGVTYRALPAYSPAPAVASNTEATVYSTLLYENASPNAYKVFASLTLDRHSSDPTLNNLDFSLGERPFGIIDYETLEEMDEDESIKVLVINPRENTRSGRLYYGIGTEGKLAWESCGYNTSSCSYNDLFARANAVYEENASYSYTGYSYTGFNNSKSGYAAWTGNTGEDPSTGNVFNYTGARSRYFKTLTKSGGLFTIEGLAINPATETSITGIRIERGKLVSGKVPKNTPNKLLRFVNNTTGRNLKSDCSWSASTAAAAKISNLVWDTGDNQDHQFILFGKYCQGGLLNRMLKENNKSVPLTYMARNEEINVIINVYYADQEGTLDFVVDNSTWSTATEISHIFN